jgi:hypothetical protein
MSASSTRSSNDAASSDETRPWQFVKASLVTRLMLLSAIDCLEQREADACIKVPRVFVYGATNTSRAVDLSDTQSFVTQSALGQLATLAGSEKAGYVLLFCVWAIFEGGRAVDGTVRALLDDHEPPVHASDRRDPERLVEAIAAHMARMARSFDPSQAIQCLVEVALVGGPSSDRTCLLDYTKPSFFRQQSAPLAGEPEEVEQCTAFWSLADVRKQI